MRCGVITLCLLTPVVAVAQEPTVFSGPQVGERLPPLTVTRVLAEGSDELDILSQAGDGPVVLIFVHERTRPAFGLMNTVMRMAAERTEKGLTAASIFLTDDATETGNWIKRIPNYFAKGPIYGISPDGLEGPGAYGLNRNVSLTVLVGEKQRVTANFALVQPSIQADGPKIFQEIVNVTGGGDVPDVAKFSGQRAGDAMRMDARLERMFRRVVNKETSADDLTATIQSIKEYVAENKAAQQQLGQAARGVDRDSIENETVREQLAAWGREYAAARPMAPNRDLDAQLRTLLQPVINKNATVEQVAKAAEAVEAYAKEHPQARLEIGRRTRRIIEAGVLENYGTPAAQDYFQKWAKEFVEDSE